jgi:hypothetical protein
MQLTAAQMQNEAAFWLNQDREHNLFFMLGFQDPTLKKAAEQLYNAYDLALRRGDLQQAMAIVPSAQAFKTHALQILRTPWGAGSAGYIWPSFVEHTKHEIDMMLARLRPGGITSREELCFGDRMLADHAAFASHLLDPIEQKALSKAAADAANGIGEIANRCATETLGTLVALSQKAQTDLDTFMKNPAVANGSTIHPVLADHVVREGQRFQGFLNATPMDEAPAQ